MKIEETIVTSHLDLKKLVRRSIQVSADSPAPLSAARPLRTIRDRIRDMKIEETIVTSHLDLKKLVRRSIQVSADILSETARYGQNVAKILLEDGGTDNRPLKHSEAASVSPQIS